MSATLQTLETLNALQPVSFVAELAEVFEHAPWVAEAAAAGRPYPTVAALHDAMMRAVRAAPRERQSAFIGGHPELGSRVKRADLTGDSQAEQGGLGLDRLSAEEFERFSRLNAAYREKFGFPFIVCVRRHTRDSILKQFERRLGHDTETERARAIVEIGLIARLRLVAKVDGPGLPQTTGRLSTHVLDLAAGRPAQGVAIALHEIGGSARGLLRKAITNADGRTDAPLIAGEPLRIGTYELTFHVGEYFATSLPSPREAVGRVGAYRDSDAHRGGGLSSIEHPPTPDPSPPRASRAGGGEPTRQRLDPKARAAITDPPFLNVVPIRFSIAEPEGNYHVPLLMTPWSYTTYRGS
jgi:2-oxo-4-hydroxy-4-carboxy-5-ureidoimidazoline decarboxylase